MPSRFTEFPERYYPLVARSPYSVLLQTSRCDAENYRSYLFLRPEQVIAAEKLEELPALFVRIEQALQGGNFVAGLFSYECGGHFEPAASGSSDASGLPLAWFGVYSPGHTFVFDHREGCFILDRGEGRSGEPPGPPPESPQSDTLYEISNLRLNLAEDVYSSQVEAVHEYIRAGDTYQVNLTGNLTFAFSGSPLGLFRAVNASQPVPYNAWLHLGEQQVLSFSPELFFRIGDGRIVTRPMKGTARRGRTREEDDALAVWLRSDPKNRSENVIIVDLLRNDLGRICELGSVRAEKEELFTVEKYDTLFQMTSTVSGRLRTGTGLYEIFQSLFPSGSVTGAPKIRTMQIIRQLERRRRGVYTGAIGFFAPGGESVFNVAIRTVVLGEGRGEMGVGSGITIDSVAQDEYRECLIKAEFLTCPVPRFALIETLLWDGQRYPMLGLHLQRLEDSARYFGFPFDGLEVRELLDANACQLPSDVSQKVRLTLSRQGEIRIENAEIGLKTETGMVAISPVRTSSLDRFLYHKTTNRQLYNETFERAQRDGHDDLLFFNERGELTEGAINNVFVEIGGKLFTPPVDSGLLPGVFRRHLLATNPAAAEKVLTRQELLSADSVYLCNAVRGMRKVKVVTRP